MENDNENALALAEVSEAQLAEIAERALEEKTPVKLIEESLAAFLTNTFDMAREEDGYQKQIKAEILKRLPDLKSSELVALITSATTNKNDLFSKLISPTMQLLSTAQQAEMAKQKEAPLQLSQNNIKELNATVSSDVLLGMKSLVDMVNAAQQHQRRAKS